MSYKGIFKVTCNGDSFIEKTAVSLFCVLLTLFFSFQFNKVLIQMQLLKEQEVLLERSNCKQYLLLSKNPFYLRLGCNLDLSVWHWSLSLTFLCIGTTTSSTPSPGWPTPEWGYSTSCLCMTRLKGNKIFISSVVVSYSSFLCVIFVSSYFEWRIKLNSKKMLSYVKEYL